LLLVTIYITGPGGQYDTNVEAMSSHEAVRKGAEFFLDPFRKDRSPGPEPPCVCPDGLKRDSRPGLIPM
jgi:hypothetical protein